MIADEAGPPREGTRRSVVLRRFGPPDVMTWEVGPLPPRGPTDVLIAVEAIGVNFGDTMVRRGEYRRGQSLDFTPGFEVAGRVVEGPRAGPAPGTSVLAFTENGGGYADAVVAPLDHVHPLLEGVAPRDGAALFTQGVTAWYAVHRYGRVRPGEAVLVHGSAGGLGSLCVQLAAHAEAQVIGTASSEERLALAREHGARHVIDARVPDLAAAVRDCTAGDGADVVLDGVGGALFEPSLRALAFGGRYVVVGSASQEPAWLDARRLMPRGQTIAGFVVARVSEEDPAEPRRAFDEIQRLFLQGVVRPRVTVLGALDVRGAHELLESRRHAGKIVLDVARS